MCSGPEESWETRSLEGLEFLRCETRADSPPRAPARLGAMALEGGDSVLGKDLGSLLGTIVADSGFTPGNGFELGTASS